jgi:nitrile hydratase accessory protein
MPGGTVRADATELGDARRRIDALVSDLPSELEDRSFEHPWELRAFAIAVAAYQNGQYEWSEFQLSLAQAVKRWEDTEAAPPWAYYERWLEALETVLAGNGALSDADLDDRMKAVLAVPKTANHHEAHREPVAIDPALPEASVHDHDHQPA